MTPPRILITAGPTQEPIDDVRYLSNRSSGRLGTALALEAHRRGWTTTLLLGPVCGSSEPPQRALGDRLLRFRTSRDLEASLAHEWPGHDLLIMAAAVADWRPISTADGKLRREGTLLSLALEPVPDLVAALAKGSRANQTIIGFALEPADGMLESAVQKLRRKGLRAVVANSLATMDSATIDATLVVDDGRHLAAPRQSKEQFAVWLLDHCIALHGEST